MICISCDTEINPKWKAAIDKNLCPFCGNVILDENLKEMLSSLAILMDDLNKFPSELNDYLLSNYHYIKTDAENLIDFVSPELLAKNNTKMLPGTKRVEKISDGKQEIEVHIEKNQSEEETSSFHARALNKKSPSGTLDEVSEKNNKLKEIANRIKASGNYEVDANDEPDVEGSENFDQDYAQVMKQQSVSLPNDYDLPPIVENQIANANPEASFVPTSKADFEILRKMRLKEQNQEISENRPTFGSK